MARKTQEELLKEQRVELEADWCAKYPHGQFCLQEFHGERSLHWLPKRATAWKVPHGISVYDSPERGIFQHPFRRSAFGKVRNYNSCAKLVAAARRAGFSEQLIVAFEKAMVKP